MVWWSAILIGFAGSFHCVGMCGPLALAVPTAGGKHPRTAGLLYHLGRITTYSLIGLVLGGLGFSVSAAGWQQGLSIALGIVMLAAVLTPALVPAPKLGPYYAALNRLKLAMRKQLKRRNLLAGYTVGLLNGFLPCGLVYLGLAGAMATYDPLKGAAYMAAFGLGTLPLMVGLTTLGPMLTPSLRARFRAAVPYVVGVMGIVLILRGMDLGIPYLSPVLPETVQAEIEVCH